MFNNAKYYFGGGINTVKGILLLTKRKLLDLRTIGTILADENEFITGS